MSKPQEMFETKTFRCRNAPQLSLTPCTPPKVPPSTLVSKCHTTISVHRHSNHKVIYFPIVTTYLSDVDYKILSKICDLERHRFSFLVNDPRAVEKWRKKLPAATGIFVQYNSYNFRPLFLFDSLLKARDLSSYDDIVWVCMGACMCGCACDTLLVNTSKEA